MTGVEGKGREGPSTGVHQVIGTKRESKGSRAGRDALSGRHLTYYMEKTRTSAVSPLPHTTGHAHMHTRGREARQEWERLTAGTGLQLLAVTSYRPRR